MFKRGQSNYALIMAAVVAMVAVVGLVMWSQGDTSGAAVLQNRIVIGEPGESMYYTTGCRGAECDYHILGEQLARNAMESAYNQQDRGCEYTCIDACRDNFGVARQYPQPGMDVRTCVKWCADSCDQEADKLASIAGGSQFY